MAGGGLKTSKWGVCSGLRPPVAALHAAWRRPRQRLAREGERGGRRGRLWPRKGRPDEGRARCWCAGWLGTGRVGERHTHAARRDREGDSTQTPGRGRVKFRHARAAKGRRAVGDEHRACSEGGRWQGAEADASRGGMGGMGGMGAAGGLTGLTAMLLMVTAPPIARFGARCFQYTPMRPPSHPAVASEGCRALASPTLTGPLPACASAHTKFTRRQSVNVHRPGSLQTVPN